ncbi:MAG: hypothetical protein JW860_08065, partial [Sedimentisphaerales bacterium]|nr:hypothetical protein [Sedimentisphaerales bacterium]
MSVQFILGRSGSGKTFHCIEAIKSEFYRNPEGPALILLVPEQATFQMEQALTDDDRLTGYHRVRVLSFERLARLILAETGPPTLPVLSEFSKQMILRRLLQECQNDLQVFHRSVTRSGFLRQLSRMIRELRQYGHGPEDLDAQQQEILNADQPEQTDLVKKLSDLALIFRSYQDTIAGRFMDPDNFLDLVADRCPKAGLFQGGRLWVDGFAGFTTQQFQLLT